MSIHIRTGDIFSSDAHVLVNPVNCVGVMGKGLALQFKKRYPKMYETYVEWCHDKYITVGQPQLYTASTPRILLFPTKLHWRNPSTLYMIDESLYRVAERYQEWNITSIAFPKIGTGEGGLSWDAVKPMIESYLGQLQGVEVYIYE